MKAVGAAFNQEKALVGAFSVIVKTGCETDGALQSTSHIITATEDPGSPVVVSAGVERGGEEEVGGVAGQLAHAQVEVGALQVEVRGQEDAPRHQVASIHTDV